MHIDVRESVRVCVFKYRCGGGWVHAFTPVDGVLLCRALFVRVERYETLSMHC